ncbi:MAG: phosphodiester glycosidase family protein [Anaerolineae bacterium]|nr:phosphodiester glycosidase family protein [Anaerolineae bacterium]
MPTPTATPTATPTPSPTPYPTLSPTFTPEPPDTGWQPLLPGIELRQMNVENGPVTERVTIVRLAPAQARFRVHYVPGQPLPVSGWADALERPLVVNGGYFTPEYETVGLLVSDGHVWGTPYGDFAGMFAVTAEESVSIRWLRLHPYDPNEPLREAIQSFPVLVKPGGIMGFPADADDGRPARRTVVAQDREGNILFIVAPRGYLSLHRLAVFLASSDLNLDVALNLDGGYSTGLWLDVAGHPVQIDSLVPVPSVISVELLSAPPIHQ